eukprot:10002576-Ditylum_brightwellii.AAC.1
MEALMQVMAAAQVLQRPLDLMLLGVVRHIKVNKLSINENVNLMETSARGKFGVSTISHDSCHVHFDGWLDKDSHADMHCAGSTFT